MTTTPGTSAPAAAPVPPAAGAAPPPALPSQEDLATAAYWAAFAEIRAAQAAQTADEARKHAEELFAPTRKAGRATLDAMLPDGTPLGGITIVKGTTTVTVDDEGDLQMLVATNEGGAGFEDYLTPLALSDPAVIALVADHFPTRVGRRVKPGIRAKLLDEAKTGNGYVQDLAEGKPVKIATVHQGDPSGRFNFYPSKVAGMLLDDAVKGGVIDEDGNPLIDPVFVPEQPAAVTVSDEPAVGQDPVPPAASIEAARAALEAETS